MLFKKEVFVGPTEKARNVQSALEAAGIKTFTEYPLEGHTTDMRRGAAVGRIGEDQSHARSILSISVKNKDVDDAKRIIHDATN